MEMDNNKSDMEQNLSKIEPYPNNSWVEKPIKNPTLATNDEGELEVVEETDQMTEERRKMYIENDIKLLRDHKFDTDKIAIYHGFEDIEDWINKHKDLKYTEFTHNYCEVFPYVYDWVRVKEGSKSENAIFKTPARDITYAEYRTGMKKDEVLFEEKYNEMKKKEKLVEEMWDKYTLTTDFKVTEGEPISMNWPGNEEPTEEQIKKANVTMDENNFDEVAKDRAVVYIESEEKTKEYNDMIEEIIKEQKEKKEKEEKYKKEMDSFFNEYSVNNNYTPDWINIESESSLNARAKNNKVKLPPNEFKFPVMDVNIEDEIDKLIVNKKEQKKYMKQYINKDTDDYSKLSSELDSMEARLLTSEGFDEDQIQSIKNRIKDFEAKLREKVKPKTITISNNVHNTIKNYCNLFNLKIGDWVEKTLMDKIEDMTPKKEVVSIEKAKDELEKKYRNLCVRKKLIRTDKLIDFVYSLDKVKLSSKFKFIGYDVNDKPIYDYIGNNFEEDSKNIKRKIEVLPEGPINISTKYKTEYAEEDIHDVEYPIHNLIDEISKALSDDTLSKQIDNIVAWAKNKRG
jgi:hypothetical protein